MSDLPEGYIAWAGGESAPLDWDGEASSVMFRDGKRYPYASNWRHIGDMSEIIAYRPMTEPHQFYERAVKILDRATDEFAKYADELRRLAAAPTRPLAPPPPPE